MEGDSFMKKQSLSKNLLFQFGYQGLILVLPFLISPYLTRTLQADALGIYTYSNSIAYYFVMFSNLGISRHGQRIISQKNDDSFQLGKVFWSLFSVHVFFSILSLVLYLLFVSIFIVDNRLIFTIQAFYVLSPLFDITWLFYGLENFRSVVIKNGIVKIVECILIFVLVKTPDDLWKYTIIVTLGLLLGHVATFIQAYKMIPPTSFGIEDMLQHIKPLLVFSISVIAVSLYTVFDKTLLGILTDASNVAYYEYSEKIISIPKIFIASIGTVMFPRVCKLASEGNNKKQHEYINYSFMLTSFLGMGAVFGLIAIADSFVILFYGSGFKECGTIIMTMAPLIIIVGLGDIIRTQYMIPNGMDKEFNLCILVNAIVNIILSVLLIPHIGIYGAVIGTGCAELFGLCIQIFLCRPTIGPSEIVKICFPFFVFGAVMYGVLRSPMFSSFSGVPGLLLQLASGGCLYIVFGITYILLQYPDIRNSIQSRIRKKFR